MIPVIERLDALADAVEEGGDVLGADLLADAGAVLARAGDRLRLPEHTVVALAGPTGSGKSSLLNALTGQDLAEVAVTRPTTSEALAVVRGPGAGPLLDWLGVRRRHHLDGEGLVLLDLPDHDSVVTDHRLEADRLIGLVDLMVWVLDPQKYADATVHAQYLSGLASHRDVLLVALNQVDRLTEAERAACHRDLQQLLRADGLDGVPVLDVSARTGEGVDRLRDVLVATARRREATQARLLADVTRVAGRVLAACGPPVRTGAGPRDELVTALADAAGVPTVVRAVRESRLARARYVTGWPLTRWARRFRADPLRRLHLDPGSRTSLPERAPAQVARSRRELRAYVDRATDGAPQDWVLSARDRVETDQDHLADELDAAVARTPVQAPDPRWWRAVSAVQWLVLAVAGLGLAWLGLGAVTSFLQLDVTTAPTWHGIPVPTLLLIGGVLAGLLLSAAAAGLARIGADRQAARARAALVDAITEVADEVVIGQVAAVMASLVRTREAAERAAGGRRRRGVSSAAR